MTILRDIINHWHDEAERAQQLMEKKAEGEDPNIRADWYDGYAQACRDCIFDLESGLTDALAEVEKRKKSEWLYADLITLIETKCAAFRMDNDEERRALTAEVLEWLSNAFAIHG